MEKKHKDIEKSQILKDNEKISNTALLKTWKSAIASENISKIYKTWNILEEKTNSLWFYFILLPFEIQSKMLMHISRDVQIQIFSDIFKQDANTIQKYYTKKEIVHLSKLFNTKVHDGVWHILSDHLGSKDKSKFTLACERDDAVGIMASQYALTIAPEATVSETMQYMRKNIDNVETIYYIYVIDTQRKLKGVISLRDLMRHKKHEKVCNFMVKHIYSVKEHTDQEVVASILRKNNLLAVPVVDHENTLRGIVMFNDVIHVIDEEYNEDVLNMGGIGSQPQNFTYLESSVFQQFKTRIPWLIFLLVAGTLTSNIISIFNATISIAHYLVLFIPIVISTGGNIATQSSTLIICGLVRHELDYNDLFFVILKEVMVAFFIGLCLGLVMLGRGILFPPQVRLLEASAISLSLVFVVLFSAIIGAIFPLILSRLRIDPTVVATPFMATIIDLVGLTIYFTIAGFIL